MKEYMLVSENTPEDLSDIVTDMLNEGWQLYGAPLSCCTENEWYHYQAMVRRDT